jgi:hypothetical protein
MAALSRAAAAVLLATLLFCCGCRPKPKAPALIDEPVFQSDEGFRFLVPEDWIMTARANVPPGPAEKERTLVQYRRVSAEGNATLEISLIDLPEDADLAEYLSGPSYAVRHWNSLGKAESIEAGGASGKRFRFNGQANGSELSKEVTAFRRDGRVYFFTVLYPPKDAAAAEQARRSISGLVWTKK